MKVQKLPSYLTELGHSGQALEALDNIRFEHPFFDHPDTKVTFESLPVVSLPVGPKDQPTIELGSNKEKI